MFLIVNKLIIFFLKSSFLPRLLVLFFWEITRHYEVSRHGLLRCGRRHQEWGMLSAPPRVWEWCCVSVSPVSLSLPWNLNIDPESACRAQGISETHGGLHFTLGIILSLSLRSEEIKSTILRGNQILTVINLIMCCWKSKRSLTGRQVIEFFKEFRVSIIKHLDKAVFLKRHVKLSITWDI